MANLCSNKKKIRGWKRQIRKIERWKNYQINLDIDNFLTQKRDYVKITIDPWYRIVKRNPPIWYDRLILEGLIDIYFSWRKTLQELGKPFYLKIWLYEPHFIRSQVVAAIGKWRNYYQNIHNFPDVQRDFPLKKYQLPKYNLDDFQWQLHLDEEYVSEYFDELNTADMEKLNQVAFRSGLDQYGKKYWVIKNGYVWEGSLGN